MERLLQEEKYEGLSPFELKNKLIEMATSHHERIMLFCRQGKSELGAVEPRYGFFQLGLFALEELQRRPHRPARIFRKIFRKLQGYPCV